MQYLQLLTLFEIKWWAILMLRVWIIVHTVRRQTSAPPYPHGVPPALDWVGSRCLGMRRNPRLMAKWGVGIWLVGINRRGRVLHSRCDSQDRQLQANVIHAPYVKNHPGRIHLRILLAFHSRRYAAHPYTLQPQKRMILVHPSVL